MCWYGSIRFDQFLSENLINFKSCDSVQFLIERFYFRPRPINWFDYSGTVLIDLLVSNRAKSIFAKISKIKIRKIQMSIFLNIFKHKNSHREIPKKVTFDKKNLSKTHLADFAKRSMNSVKLPFSSRPIVAKDPCQASNKSK